MCGIAGWLNLADRPNSSGDGAVLHEMCQSITHRGPDSEGTWMGASAALGMRRLAIIDLSPSGEQPVFSEDKMILAIMNGEIYNAPELRRELIAQGHSFRGNSDTEVIPHLYEEYNDQFIEKLNGMFAIVIWDATRKRALIFRDRMGVKPLYYGVFGGKLIFGSELKAMAAHPEVERKLSVHALQQFLTFDYIPAPHSIFENIYKLPAAHSIVVENGDYSIKQYWELSFKKNEPIPTIEDAAENLRDLLADATRIRLISDVPTGVLLSGGLDSSMVAALAQRESNTKIKSYSIGFEEASFDESKYARNVAEFLGTDHHEAIFSENVAATILPEVAHWLDEPMADPSLLPTFLLSRFAKSEVTVALGGDGADELFAGYPSYYAHKFAERYEKLPNFVRRNLIEDFIWRLPVSQKNMSFEFMAKRFFTSLQNTDMVARHHSFFGSFSVAQQNNLMTNSAKSLNGGDVYSESRDWLKNCDANNIIERTQFLDIKSYLAEGILTKVDRASMAVSLEVRSPFLDKRVVEFAAGLPEGYKLKCNTLKFSLGNTGKFVVKKAAEGLIPPIVTARRKNGFVIPIASFLRNQLRPLLHDLLAPDRLRDQGLFEPTEVQRLLSEHDSGAVNHAKQLWTLLVFQLWVENFCPESKMKQSLGDLPLKCGKQAETNYPV